MQECEEQMMLEQFNKPRQPGIHLLQREGTAEYSVLRTHIRSTKYKVVVSFGMDILPYIVLRNPYLSLT